MDPTSYPPPPSVPEPPVPGMPPAPPSPPPADLTPPPPAPEIPEPAPPAPPAFETPVAAPPGDPAAGAPQYAPPPPPESMPPSYAAQAAPPPKKKSKTLVIILAILGVLLLCCVGGIVGAFTIFDSDTEVSTETSTDFDSESEAPADTTDESAPADETGGRAEWVEFQPALVDPSIYAEPTAEQSDLIEEVHAKLYPDFKIEDTLAEPGGEDAENYYPDMLYVKATLTSNPDVRIAYYMWTDSEASAAAGVHLTQDNAESYETLAQSSSGLSYIYDHENLAGLMEGTVDERIVAALTQAEEDFPGYVAMMVGEDGDNIGVVLTRWDAFADLELGLAVTYAPDGNGWTVSDVTDW